MAGFNDFNDTTWEMTEFEGMCSMPMMAAEDGYPSTASPTSSHWLMDSSSDDADYSTAETHFHEQIGEMEPSQPFVQPNVWAPELRAGGDQVKTELEHRMQRPYRVEEETHANTLPHAPTSPLEHPSMMPTVVFDEEASAPAHPLAAQRQPVLCTHRPVKRRRRSEISSASFSEASLQEAVRRLAPQRPGPNPPTPSAASSPDRSKRGSKLDVALLHKGAPLPKTPLLPASPAKPPPPKRRKLAAASAPGAAAVLAQCIRPDHKKQNAAPVRQALGSAPPSSSASMLLSACKFVSKRTLHECLHVPRLATHKRGYLTCACSAGHQWVWCATCCACPRPAKERGCLAGRGCDNAAHWFERDAFDTGRRNHMNRHEEK